jgi:hypothetical protein
MGWRVVLRRQTPNCGPGRIAYFAHIVRPLLVSAAAVAALAHPLSAAPRDKVFTIANYPVEATAKDAVAAKEKAHADGQQAAFGALLKRLVPVTAYAQIDRLKSMQAANFVDGVAIRSESNSRTEYIASLDFSFQPDAIRGLLKREGVPFVEEQSPTVVLIPVMTQADPSGGVRYRTGGDTWAKAWKVLDLDNTLTPMRIETLLPSIQDNTINAALAGDDSAERVLTTEYKADYVMFVIAEIDDSNKQLNVTLAGIDAAGLVSWRRGYHLDGGDVSYAMELAAVVTQGVLEGRWKVAKGEEGGGTGGIIQMAVSFSSPDEWDDMRRQILDTPGIDDVRIGTVSANSADLSVRFPGGGVGLAPVLAQQGLTLSGSGQAWSLRSGY